MYSICIYIRVIRHIYSICTYLIVHINLYMYDVFLFTHNTIYIYILSKYTYIYIYTYDTYICICFQYIYIHCIYIGVCIHIYTHSQYISWDVPGQNLHLAPERFSRWVADWDMEFDVLMCTGNPLKKQYWSTKTVIL